MALADREEMVFEPGRIGSGGNSGFQALNLVVNLGAVGVVLIGFDMRTVSGLSHWHGDHERPLHNPQCETYARWRAAFERAAGQLKSRGVTVLNASPVSALTCFRRIDLK